MWNTAGYVTLTIAFLLGFACSLTSCATPEQRYQEWQTHHKEQRITFEEWLEQVRERNRLYEANRETRKRSP